VTLVLRRNDYTLTDEQGQLVDMLRSLFTEQSAIDVVRASEPLGFDQNLWSTVQENGLLTISIPESVGGDGGGLVELVLAGIEIGRTAAPVPLLDHVVSMRLLASLKAAGVTLNGIDFAAALAGDLIVSMAPISTWELGSQLVPSGAVAKAVVAFKDGAIILMTRESNAAQAQNEGCAPVAWWSPTDADVRTTTLLEGAEAVGIWELAHREWRIATAASLVGLLAISSEIARSYALDRKAFGVTIAKFQAISHQLADIHMDVVTSRNMTIKAAWLTENEPDFRPELAAMAMAHATRAALRSTAKAVHVHGGMGITNEADISLFYRKVSSWSLVGGGIRRDLDDISNAIDRRAQELAAATLTSSNR
jgi:alkylation response protein AidB-like acyl-CoA dehydrogenase